MTQATIAEIAKLSATEYAVKLTVDDNGVKTAMDLRVSPTDLTPERLSAIVRSRLSGLKVAETSKVALAVGTSLDLTDPVLVETPQDVWFRKFSTLTRLLNIRTAGIDKDSQHITDLQAELAATYDPAFVA